jgi:hypothetical protein
MKTRQECKITKRNKFGKCAYTIAVLPIVFVTAAHVSWQATRSESGSLFGGMAFVSLKVVFSDRKFGMIKRAYLLLMDKHVQFSPVNEACAV